MPCDPVSDHSPASKPLRNSGKAFRASPGKNAAGTRKRATGSKAHARASGGITLRDIAKKLGVSHVTVSLALRDAPGVSETLRRQIHTVAEEMGYRPNADAAALGRRRSAGPEPPTATSLAWIDCGREPLQPRRSKELALYWQGARNAAERYGRVLEVFDGTTNLALEYSNLALKARNVTGILVAFHPLLPKYWEKFPWQDYSVVRLGTPILRPAFPSVASDHFSNCLLAIENIRALGYPRIGFVANRATNKRVMAGYYAAQLGLPEPHRIPNHLLTSHTNNIIEQQRLDQWVRKHRPDALLTDVQILPLMLKSAGYRIPHEIGLASLNILDSPDIAGIDPKPEALGNAAAEMLILQLNARGLNIPESSREMLIVGEWKPGASLPPRPNAVLAKSA